MTFMNSRRWWHQPGTTCNKSRTTASRARGRLMPLLLESLENRTLLSVSLSLLPQWVENGPGPMKDPAATNGFTQIGAIQAIAADPNNADNLYVATVNGGVWHTTNATTSD